MTDYEYAVPSGYEPEFADDPEEPTDAPAAGEILSTRAAAAYLGVPQQKLKRAVHVTGTLRPDGYLTPRQMYFRRATLDAWAAHHLT